MSSVINLPLSGPQVAHIAPLKLDQCPPKVDDLLQIGDISDFYQREGRRRGLDFRSEDSHYDAQFPFIISGSSGQFLFCSLA
jgi:hypothetical protein